jgi:transposase-like protein
MSKTQEAIALVNQGMTPFAAAKQVGLSPNTLYVALRKLREKKGVEPCPCCGSMVPTDTINRDVLKSSGE